MGGNNMLEYKKVDNLQAYVEVMLENGAEEIIAEKTARIAARQGIPGEEIVSWSEDASGKSVIEKQAKVAVDTDTNMPGWVVTKVDETGQEVVDRNGHLNQWIIVDTTFKRKYEAVQDSEGIYKPAGGPQRFIKLCEAIHILQWGEVWNVDAGGYINITSPGDYYVISGRDFEDTYRII